MEREVGTAIGRQKPGFSKKPGFWQRASAIRFRREAGFLILVALLGLLLRVLRLDFQPLWWDEGYSVWFATHPLGQMAALTAQDIHPPLYYALLHGWTTLLGTGPIALRLMSVAFGALAIPAIYLAGRRLLNRRAALLAALLLAINPLHIYYSQEVRMYGLVALLSAGILATIGGWANCRFRISDFGFRITPCHQPRTVLAAGARPVTLSSVPYVLLATAALYTQYYAVFLPVGLTLYALWRWRRDPAALGRWLAAQIAVAVLYLPWVIYAAPRLAPYVSQKVVADADRPLGLLAYFGRHLAAFLAGHLEGPLTAWWPVVLAPIGISGIWYWRWWKVGRRSGNSAHPIPDTQYPIPNTQYPIPNTQYPIPNTQYPVMLATVTGVALLLGWLIGLTYPFFPERGERLLLLALPPFILLVAAGLDALWSRSRLAAWGTIALIGAVAGAGLCAFYTTPRYPTDDYRPLIAHTVELGLPEDTVFCVYPWQVGYWRSYDWRSYASSRPAGPNAVLTPDATWSPAVSDALDAGLARGRVWFPAHLALGAILETRVEAYLAAEAVPFVNAWYGPGTRLSAWAFAPGGQPVNAATVRFPLPGVGAVKLVGVTAALDPVPAANAVTPVTLRWAAAAPPPILGVSVRLVDDLGQIWAQHDYEPLGGLSAPAQTSAQGTSSAEAWQAAWEAEDRLGLLIPAGTPPGRYAVELAVRPKDEARSLDAFTPAGVALGPAVPLFEITVAPADRVLGRERLPIGVNRSTDMEDGLRFLGYSAAEAVATPGELRKISLFWQTTAALAADYTAFVQLLDADGGVAAGWEAPPGAGYPTTQWAPDTLVRTQAAFRVPASLPAGRYRLIAGLFNPADGARLRTAAGADHLALGPITLRGRPHEMTPPGPAHVADVRFGDVGRLVGYDLPETGSAAGAALPLTLYWQATGATDRAYTIFVHLLDPAGALRGFGDGEPGGGQFPTTGWLPGEYLADRHEVRIVADAPPGEYRLAVGLYDPATGQRLLTADGADQVVLDISAPIR